MAVVRIDDELLKEMTLYLRAEGLLRENASQAGIVRSFIRHSLWGRTDIKNGEQAALEVLKSRKGVRSPFLSGMVGRWKRARELDAPDMVTEEELAILSEAMDAVEPKIPIPETVTLREEDQQSESCPKRKRLNPNVAPWINLMRRPLKLIYGEMPRHDALQWCKDDPLRILAVECAFGSLPSTLWKKPKLMDLAYELHNIFLEWQTKYQPKRDKVSKEQTK